MNDNFSSTFVGGFQPSQVLANDDWNDEKYKENIRWILQNNYNMPIMTSQLLGADGNDPYVGLNTRFNDQFVFALRYLNGTQYHTQYEWASKDALNNNTQIPMWRGLDIYKMFNYFDGKLRNFLTPITKVIQCNGATENIIAKKLLKADVIKRIVAANEFIKSEKLLEGIALQTDDALDLEDDEAVETYLQSFQDATEAGYRNFALDFLYKNKFKDMFLKCGAYNFAGGRCQIKVYEVKGQVQARIIEPPYSIIDMSKNEDHHYNDDFGGEFRPYTIPEIQTRFDFTKEELLDLENIAKTGTGNEYAWINLNWVSNVNNVPKVWVADVQWRSTTTIDGVIVECIREGQLIANKYIKNARIAQDSIADKFNPSSKVLDFITYTPRTMLGSNMGIVMTVHRIQDMKDGITTLMQGILARAMGTVLMIDESQMPDLLKAPDFVAQLKQIGIAVTNKANIDREVADGRPVEVIDLSVNPSIQYYLQQVQYWDGVLADIMNIPNVTRTGGQGYTSEAQIINTNNGSEIGTQWIYEGILEFTLNVVDVAVRKKRILAAKKGADVALQVGDTFAQLLKSKDIQDMLEDEYFLYFNYNNNLTEKVKEVTSQMAVQEASINPDAMLKYINIQKANTLDEVEMFLKKERRRREKMEMAKMEADRAAAERNATINANAMQNNTAMQSATILDKAEMDNEAALEQQLLQQEQTNINQ
jgi:hypothetical protein